MGVMQFAIYREMWSSYLYLVNEPANHNMGLCSGYYPD
jgi:hypothetical protein